jgi:hypothetical protein
LGEDPGLALSHYRTALADRETLAAAGPESAAAQRAVLVAVERVGDALQALGQFNEAAAAFRREVTLAQDLAAADPKNRDFARLVWLAGARLAEVLEKTGDEGIAEAARRKSWAAAEQLLALGPVTASDREEMAEHARAFAALLRVRVRKLVQAENAQGARELLQEARSCLLRASEALQMLEKEGRAFEAGLGTRRHLAEDISVLDAALEAVLRGR